MNNDIQFEQVSCYNAEGEQVLKETSFHIPGNCLLALAGDPASCRAVMELLTGARALPGGCIRVGSRELTKLPAGQVFCLNNEAIRPEQTIYQHIAAARADATEMEVLEAAAAAMVLDLTWELREGIHSSCCELTDVQRHCISIAKAILQAAPVVVMDAFAGADAQVWEAMRALAKHKTVVMTGDGELMFQFADVVLILKDGSVAVCENRLYI